MQKWLIHKSGLDIVSLFSIELDDEEVLYDQLWKDYFKSVNIQARQNMKLHINMYLNVIGVI